MSVKLRFTSKEATRCNSSPFFRLSGLVYRRKPTSKPEDPCHFPFASIHRERLSLTCSFHACCLPFQHPYTRVTLYTCTSLSLSLFLSRICSSLFADESLSLSLSHICIYVRMCSPWCRFLSLLACTNYIYTEGRTELELKAAIERPTASEPWRPEFISSTPPF